MSFVDRRYLPEIAGMYPKLEQSLANTRPESVKINRWQSHKIYNQSRIFQVSHFVAIGAPCNGPNHPLRVCACLSGVRFMSLLRKVRIEEGDSQSEVGLSWLLIILSISLLASAVVECFIEVCMPYVRHSHKSCAQTFLD